MNHGDENGSINLYWRSEVLNSDISQLKDYGYLVDEFDCSPWRQEGELHEALKKQLKLPAYYSGNLDALNDHISDLVIPDESGRALAFRRFDVFSGQFPKLAWQILNIIDLNSQRAILMGRRLITLVQSDNPRIEFDPVGARHAE